MTEVTTRVQEIDLNIDNLFAQPGAESVMTPDENEKKPGIFSPMKTDTTFLDKHEPTKTDPPEAGIEDDPIDDPLHIDVIVENDDKKKTGRPTGLVSVAKKLIEKGSLIPFEDDKKLEDYTEDDFTELLEANLEQFQAKLEEDLPAKFFSQMPAEMQQAYEYIANGGTDIKGLFRALAVTSEVRDLDISETEGQKYAIRTYLQATRYGTPDEIEDEINGMEDRNELEKKAKQFKPKLDALQQTILNQKLAEQAESKKVRMQQSQKYIDSVYNILEKGDLGGMKLNTKTQNLLYAGLTQSNYPSMSGRQTNMLGHLLEKYQWVEPNHALIAEALWLLADPDDYKKTIASNADKLTNAKTLRALKTEQANKNAAEHLPEDDKPGNIKRPGLQRQQKNFFARS